TDAQVTANAANTAATNANNNANGRVPNTRKVNNKPLSTDITLSAGDVGAYTKTESDARYMKNALNVRLGAKTRYSPSSNRVSWNWEAPAGNVLTGLVVDETGSNSADNISGAWYRPLQSLVNGQWVTISGL
ncbi:TPA: phage tail protein, partial [Providencia alcalifaciens]